MGLIRFLRGLRSVLGFLTVIPVRSDAEALRYAGEFMYLFPLVGILVGLCAGAFAWGLLQTLPGILVGVLTVGFLLMLTGLHHTDGLLDFGDALMFQGTPEEKVAVMHDRQRGTGGLTLAVIIMLATIFSVAELQAPIIAQSLIVAEVSAKLSMVLLAWAGRSAHPGLNTYFVNGMHQRYRKLRLTTALGISVATAIYLLGVVGLLAIAAGILASLLMLVVSSKNFMGVTGDVFGASNEVTRMVSLIVILGVVRWM